VRPAAVNSVGAHLRVIFRSSASSPGYISGGLGIGSRRDILYWHVVY